LSKKLFDVARTANLTLIVQAKDNQPTLLQRARDIGATTTPRASVRSHDRGRNRDERRSVAVFEAADRFAETDWHGHVHAVIRVEREVFTRSSATGLLHRSAETAFYVANACLSAETAAQAIREHWRIENTSHYSRDVTMGEDRSRIRSNPAVFARVRSFAFNILKANQASTLTQDRYRAALGGLVRMLNMLKIRKR
jgi:predicted transposase YbfD/YdcC